jgi:hypothetical protein
MPTGTKKRCFPKLDTKTENNADTMWVLKSTNNLKLCIKNHLVFQLFHEEKTIYLCYVFTFGTQEITYQISRNLEKVILDLCLTFEPVTNTELEIKLN